MAQMFQIRLFITRGDYCYQKGDGANVLQPSSRSSVRRDHAMGLPCSTSTQFVLTNPWPPNLNTPAPIITPADDVPRCLGEVHV